MAFTCSVLPPIALRPERPREAEPDFMSPPVLEEPDIVPDVLLELSLEDDPAPVLELAAGDEPVLLVLLDGELPLLDVLDVSLLLPVELGLLPLPPPVLGLPLLAPAPDDDPLAAPLPEPLPLPAPLCANADVVSIAPATVSASALIHVFITVLLMAVNGCPTPPQLAWRRSATFRRSCSAGGASTRASRGNVTGRPSRAER
jgi:hypothetical protein